MLRPWTLPLANVYRKSVVVSSLVEEITTKCFCTSYDLSP